MDIEFDHFDLSLMGATKQREYRADVDFSIWLGLYDDVSSTQGFFLNEKFEADTFEGRLVSTGNGPWEGMAGWWY